MKGGGYEKTETALRLWWNPKVVVAMATNIHPALHPAWKTLLEKKKKEKQQSISSKKYRSKSSGLLILIYNRQHARILWNCNWEVKATTEVKGYSLNMFYLLSQCILCLCWAQKLDKVLGIIFTVGSGKTVICPLVVFKWFQAPFVPENRKTAFLDKRRFFWIVLFLLIPLSEL